jgi:hypothetical protein
MQLVRALGVPGFDLVVAGSADGTDIDWVAPELWPIRLSLGVTLIAPNVHFVPPSGSPSTAFVINSTAPSDTARIQILGQPGAPVVVGIDVAGRNLQSTSIAIDDGDTENGGHNLPLVLQDVWLNATQVGLRIGPGADVSVGNTVAIGSTYVSYLAGQTTPVKGSTGILCAGNSNALASLSALVPSYSTLTVDSQTTRDIDAEGNCLMSLNVVTLGVAPAYPGGIGSCASKADSTGLYVLGSSQIGISDLTVQCMDGWGSYVLGTDAGTPVVTATYGAFQNCGCGGVYLAGGAELAAQVYIHACQIGLQIDDDWRHIPGNFQPGSYSSIGCNSSAEPSDLCRTRAGMDLLNSTSASSADARGLAWDRWSDAGTTQVWACTDTAFTSCACTGPFCPAGTARPLVDKADAVYLQSNTAPQPFDFQGGSADYGSCN